MAVDTRSYRHRSGSFSAAVIVVTSVLIVSGSAQQNKGLPGEPAAETESSQPPGIQDLPSVDWGPDSSETAEETMERFRREGRTMPADGTYVVPDGIPPLGMDPDDPPRAERPAALYVPYTIRVGANMSKKWFDLYGGNWQSVHARIYEMVAYTNDVLAANLISARLTYVHGRWWNLVAGASLDDRRRSMQWILDNMPNRQASLADRNREKLDLVVTLGKNLSSNFCGVAYVPAWPVAAGGRFHHFVVQDGRYDSSVCPRNFSNVTFAHEFGHAAGLQHDRITYQVAINQGKRLGWPGPPYSYGWQNCGVSRTVMSYGDSCGKLWPSHYSNTHTPFVHLFSTPWKLDARLLPVGRNTTEETHNVNGPVYGARRVQEMAPFIASYR